MEKSILNKGEMIMEQILINAAFNTYFLLTAVTFILLVVDDVIFSRKLNKILNEYGVRTKFSLKKLVSMLVLTFAESAIPFFHTYLLWDTIMHGAFNIQIYADPDHLNKGDK